MVDHHSRILEIGFEMVGHVHQRIELPLSDENLRHLNVPAVLHIETTGEEPRPRQNIIGICTLQIDIVPRVALAGEDECPPPTLDTAIICRIDDTPFHGIPVIRQTTENNAEVTAPLRGRGLEETIYILKKDIARLLVLDYVIDVPPEDPFLADNPLGFGGCHGVVLTWESTHQQVVFGDRTLDLGDILVTIVGTLGKIPIVAGEGELRLATGFPLIRPYGLETLG